MDLKDQIPPIDRTKRVPECAASVGGGCVDRKRRRPATTVVEHERILLTQCHGKRRGQYDWIEANGIAASVRQDYWLAESGSADAVGHTTSSASVIEAQEKRPRRPASNVDPGNGTCDCSGKRLPMISAPANNSSISRGL